MLRVERLGVRYGPIAAVRAVSLTCAPGQVVALVGPNGAGKSSTLLAIAGALSNSNVSGSVTVDDREVTRLSAERVVRRGISLVPEGRHVFGRLTVRQNLQLGATIRGDGAAVAADLEALCERFPVLGERCSELAGMLSGGEQQQLAIARALMGRPRFLLLDEPSLGLAPKVVDAIFDLIVELRDEGLGIVLVEQNVARSIELADHSILLRHGVVESEGAQHDAERILEHYFGSHPTPAEASP